MAYLSVTRYSGYLHGTLLVLGNPRYLQNVCLSAGNSKAQSPNPLDFQFRKTIGRILVGTLES